MTINQFSLLKLFLIIFFILICRQSFALNLIPTAEGGLLFPVPSVVVPFAFGMNHHQIGGGIGGSHCLSGDINCKQNYSASIAYGYGDPTHIANVDVFATFSNSPELPSSESNTSHGSIGSKFRHYFPKTKTAIATGFSWMVLHRLDDSPAVSHYLAVTQLIPSHLNRLSSNNFPISVSAGMSQGIAFNQITCITDTNAQKNLSTYYPFVGFGFQLTPKVAIAIDEYYRGIINVGMTTPLFNTQAKISIGLLNALAQHEDQQSRALMLTMTL